MKQHITPKQLNELSDKGKEKLRNKNIDGIMCILNGGYKLPLLSIGQMIEFLSEGNDLTILYDGTPCKWKVFLSPYPDPKKKGAQIYSEVELADALFEAVKEVLCN